MNQNELFDIQKEAFNLRHEMLNLTERTLGLITEGVISREFREECTKLLKVSETLSPIFSIEKDKEVKNSLALKWAIDLGRAKQIFADTEIAFRSLHHARKEL